MTLRIQSTSSCCKTTMTDILRRKGEDLHCTVHQSRRIPNLPAVIDFSLNVEGHANRLQKATEMLHSYEDQDPFLGPGAANGLGSGL